MGKEFVVNSLEEPCDDVFDKYGNYKYPSDVELAEPNTATSMPCDDVVSRQAALDIFTATKLKKFDFILYAREEIKKLPLVTPQPKIGHWINMEISINGDMSAECDKCGCIVRNSFTNNSINYCPNCGAKMVEPQERSDKE